MATLDWDGLVFYDQQIKKHIENKLVNEAISKDELDKILDKYASKTYVSDEIAKIDLTIYAKTSDVDTKLANYVKKTDAFSGSYNDLTDKPTIPNVTGKADKTYVDTELANHVSSTKHITDDERTKWNGYNDTINTMKTNFEDGVNTIYNAVVAKGVTPLDKSPSNVAKAIESLEIKEKGQLLLTCKSNSDKLPAPKFNDDNSYNYTCEDIDNGDGTFTRNIYGTKEINQICFYGDENSTSYFKSLEYTTNVKLLTAKNMFYACNYLEYRNLTNIDTSKCKSFESMFSNCNYLKSLDVSKFNTLQVTNMSNMFISCKSLTSLNVSNFNTSQVTNMYQMFNSCTSLTSLDVSNFNT